MSTIQELFHQAQLAEAAYANFSSGLSTADALQDANNNMRFSAAQATAFVDQWSVIHHIPDTASGFSATLFQNNAGEYSLAIRRGQ